MATSVIPQTVSIEEIESTRTDLAVLPSQETSIEIVDARSNFALAKQRRMLKESYTGAAKIKLDDMDRRGGATYLIIKGAYIDHVEDIDKTTGEATAFDQVLFKLEDDRIVSCGGKLATKWAKEIIADLGEFDWPESIQVAVTQHQGKNFSYPLFRTIG